MSKPSKEDVQWLVGIAVPALCSAGAFAAMRDGISEMMSAGGWAFWAYSSVLLAVGVLVGFALGRKPQPAEDGLPPDLIRRLEELPDSAAPILEALLEMDVQALELVYQMHEDSFVDADVEWLNLVDPAGRIRRIAHCSKDQPGTSDERGRKLHRYRLNADTRAVIDRLPEVFDRLHEWEKWIEEISSYEPYED